MLILNFGHQDLGVKEIGINENQVQIIKIDQKNCKKYLTEIKSKKMIKK